MDKKEMCIEPTPITNGAMHNYKKLNKQTIFCVQCGNMLHTGDKNEKDN